MFYFVLFSNAYILALLYNYAYSDLGYIFMAYYFFLDIDNKCYCIIM